MGESAAVADRVGVVGANPNRGWARDSHIPALRSLENVPLAAVATTSRASADAAAEAIGVGAGYDDPRCVVPCGVCVDRLIRRRVQVHVDCLRVIRPDCRQATTNRGARRGSPPHAGALRRGL
jgi:hypothetical protein